MKLYLKHKDKTLFLYEREYINPKDISIELVDEKDEYHEIFDLVV